MPNETQETKELSLSRYEASIAGKTLLLAKKRIGLTAPGQTLYRDHEEARRLVGLGAAVIVHLDDAPPATKHLKRKE